MSPAWSANWTLNCNAEINYWPVEVANLSECHLPLIRLTKELAVDGKRTARLLYGTDGWMAHHNTDIWRTATPVAGSVSWAIFQVGGAWLTQDMWEHYAFSMDKNYLWQIWPYLRGAALFFTESLIREPEHGWLVTAPDVNFENYYVMPDGTRASLCMGPTSSMEMVRQLFENCIAAGKALHIDESFQEKLEKLLPQLAPFQISPTTGELQEWLKDWKHADPGACEELSSWGAICADQISPRKTPALAAALRKAFDDREAWEHGAVGSWQGAFQSNVYARLGDGNTALAVLDKHLQASVNPNLTAHFQNVGWEIDGNMGQTSAIDEMLLESQDGAIDLLPALPDAWAQGALRGFRARGGFVVSMRWKGHRLSKATVLSTAGGECIIRPHQDVQLTQNGRPLTASQDKGLLVIHTKAGDILTLTVENK
jgi:alpha-L-fucosidase 2